MSSGSFVTSSAIVKITTELRLLNEDVEEILWLSPGDLYQMVLGGVISCDVSISRSLTFIKIYSCLYSIFDGSPEIMSKWLKSGNLDFNNESPINRMKTKSGLEEVNEYLQYYNMK